jgi:hypothetical protein
VVADREKIFGGASGGVILDKNVGAPGVGSHQSNTGDPTQPILNRTLVCATLTEERNF